MVNATLDLLHELGEVVEAGKLVFLLGSTEERGRQAIATFYRRLRRLDAKGLMHQFPRSVHARSQRGLAIHLASGGLGA